MKSLGRFCISFVFWVFSLVVAGVPFFAEQFLLRKTTHGLAYPAVYVLIMGLFHLLAPDSMDALRNWRDRSGLLNGLVRRLMLAWGFYAVLATVIFLLFDNSLVAQIILATTVVLGTAWLLLTQRGRQALIVAGVGISSLPQRWGASSVIVIGIAGVVGVLVAMLAMGEGFQNTLKQTGSDDTAIVLRGGSQAETNSVISRDQVPLISALAGIAKDGNGRAQVSPELSQVINLPTVSDGNDANAQLRGVGSEAWSLRPNVKMVKGRKFGAGLRELIAGQGAAKQFRGLEVGKQIELANQNWTVVGIFAAGDSHDSELWADGEVLASTYQRTSFQSVTVKLAGKDGFKDLKKALAADPRLKLDVQTTHDYYAKQSEGLTKLITALGIVIGAIMAIGAVFGALNTMYAAVAGRAREIATLRALGFRSLPVVVAVMLETMLLALLGGLLGAVLAWLVFNGYQVSTLGSNFSQVVFQFKVSPELLWNGLKWALGIGLVGGLLPALRAARLPVTTALRAA